MKVLAYRVDSMISGSWSAGIVFHGSKAQAANAIAYAIEEDGFDAGFKIVPIWVAAGLVRR